MPMTGTPPQCFTQLDAFTGPPLPQITETAQYGGRLLDYLWGTVRSAKGRSKPRARPPRRHVHHDDHVHHADDHAGHRRGGRDHRNDHHANHVHHANHDRGSEAVGACPDRPANRVEPLLAAAGWLLILAEP